MKLLYIIHHATIALLLSFFTVGPSFAQNAVPYLNEFHCATRLDQLTFVHDANGQPELHSLIVPAHGTEPLGFYVVTTTNAKFYPITRGPITSVTQNQVLMNIHQMRVPVDGSPLYFRYWLSQADQNTAFVAMSSRTPLEGAPSSDDYDRPKGRTAPVGTVTERLHQYIAAGIGSRMNQLPSTMTAARLFQRIDPTLVNAICHDYCDAYTTCRQVQEHSTQTLLQQGLAQIQTEGCSCNH